MKRLKERRAYEVLEEGLFKGEGVLPDRQSRVGFMAECVIEFGIKDMS